MFAPWNEGGQPQIETIFTILKTLDYWIREQKLNRVYVACDGGTHRAVTMFGFYLLAYHKEEAEAINNAHVLVGRPDWSNPLEYARGYIKENKIPGIQLILDNIKSSASGSYTHGDSLEDFLKNHISKEFLEQYYRERFMDYTLKTYWYWLKYEIKYFFTGTLWSNPKARIKIYVHKKLNTKLGQWYKRNNF